MFCVLYNSIICLSELILFIFYSHIPHHTLPQIYREGIYTHLISASCNMAKFFNYFSTSLVPIQYKLLCSLVPIRSVKALLKLTSCSSYSFFTMVILLNLYLYYCIYITLFIFILLCLYLVHI